MLKPLETTYRGRQIVLECTHKRDFPPPQMYGHSADDIDTMWRQQEIDHTLYQFLTTWREQCGIMTMGPKCLDCPLAKIQRPRPGRPNVVETEPWLDAKKAIHAEDMRANKKGAQPPTRPAPKPKAPAPVNAKLEAQVLGDVERPHVPAPKAGAKTPEPEDDLLDALADD